MAIVPTIGGRSCLHPGEAFRAVMEQSTPVDFWQRANSYTCPLGAEPGSAWLLMLRSELDKLDGNASHELKWVDGKRTLTIASLLIVKSSVMNLALAGDKKAACLVEFQDERRILKRFSSINKQYNVRIPAPSTTTGAGLYYTDSIDTSVVWTWQTMLDDIWESLPGASVGDGPLLPYTPDGTPEGFRFIGVGAWEALYDVLTKINCTTSYDPILDTHSYIRLGTTQAGLAASLTALKNRLMYDYDPGQDYQLANMPATVRVFFQRRELYHGIERDTPDSSNWEMAPVVSKDRATSITGATVGSVLNVWDDLPAEFNDTGSNSNSAALVTRANEIGDNVRDRISDERLRRMFSGLVTDILPGSEITEVIWRDYGDETGLVTEVIRRPKEGMDGPSARQLWTGEKFQTPDLARATHPLWPRLSQPVRVDDGSSPGETGKVLDPNTDGLFPGFVRRWANGGFIDLDACWIRPVDLQGDRVDRVGDLKQLDTLIGRLSGVETSGGSTLPVYLVREGTGSAGKGAPIGTVWGGVLAPVQHTDGLYYMDRNGQPDTDWALMDGVSNVSGSGMAMWDRLGSPEKDTFFVRARDSATDADDTAAGRTVAPVFPQIDLVTLSDHFDHTHEILDLCEHQVAVGSGGDPQLCVWDPLSPGVCSEGTSTVRDDTDFTAAAPAGVLEHTFTNGQGVADPTVNDIEMTPPNKQWHWFERIAETGATGVTPFQFVQTSQPMAPLPEQPIATGAVYQDDGTP